MFESNLGDASSAQQCYERAAALAGQPADAAEAAIGLGDIAYYRGDRKTALGDYQKAEQVLEQASRANPQVERLWLDLTRVC